MKVSITVPAHNEQRRIGNMLTTYYQFFDDLQRQGKLETEFVIVLNGCTDNTSQVVQEVSKNRENSNIIDVPQAGKGLAVKIGFADALTRNNDVIGFVDADMATRPQYFYDLIMQIGGTDCIIASRYMPGAHIDPPRPWLKEWGRRLVYNSIVKTLFGLPFYDNQCGAKLFKHTTLQSVVPHLNVQQWAFDIELLYLCKQFGFSMKEVPTTWYDQDDSKFRTIGSGTRMIKELFSLWQRYRTFDPKIK